jgi:hypothetical protein
VSDVRTSAAYGRIIAAHCDAPPHILWSEVDWDPSGGVLLLEWPLRVMRLESEFFGQLASQDVKGNVDLVLENDTTWLHASRSILRCVESISRPAISTNDSPAFAIALGWAVMRVYW